MPQGSVVIIVGNVLMPLPLKTMNLSGEWLNTGLKDGKRCLEHIELTYDLAQRTLTTVETGAKPPSVDGMNNSKLSNTLMH